MSTRLAILALALAVVSTPPNPARGAPAEAGSTRDLYLLLIRQARSDGRPRAALAYLDDFDRQHPDDLEALVLRINCLLDLGQNGPGRQRPVLDLAQQRLVRADPGVPRGCIRHDLSVCTEGLGGGAEAVDPRPMYTQASRRHPRRDSGEDRAEAAISGIRIHPRHGERGDHQRRADL